MILLRINCPDPDTAAIIARAAVGARLAACANIEPPTRLVHPWEGRTCEATETPLRLKPAEARFPAYAAHLGIRRRALTRMRIAERLE